MVLLENDILRVQIDTLGGRLTSIQTKSNDLEYLWQKSKFPHLFPFVGRLYEKRYELNGASYPMEMHGFLRNMKMTVVAQDTSSCVLELRETPETLTCYPYAFVFRIFYRLEGNCVDIVFEVKNRSETALFCAVGGHPGFNVPLEDNLTFEDYALSFPKACQPEQVVFSDNVLTTDSSLPYVLENGTQLPLRHSLFTRDAVVLKGTPGAVELTSSKGKHGVRVNYPQMPYVGFWQFDKGNPQFLCIEPWSALPGRQDVIEDLCTMQDLTKIAPEERYYNNWSIAVW